MEKENKKDNIIHVRVTDKVKALIKKRADEEGKNINAYINDILVYFLRQTKYNKVL